MGIWIPGGLNSDGGSSGPEIVTWSDGTDEQIVAMLEAHYNDVIDISDYWAVGDTRLIHFNQMKAPNPTSGNWGAQDITIVIVDMNHTDLATPINGHTKAAITVQTRECMNSSTTKNNQSTHIFIDGTSSTITSFTKWSNLYMRTYLNSTVLGAIPDGDFKSAIKQSKHYRHTTYNGTVSEEVTDTLFLPSYPEVYGTTSYVYYVATNPTEGTQFEYYQTTANRDKYSNDGDGNSNSFKTYWWLGSASSRVNSSFSDEYTWCVVNEGSITYLGGNFSCSLAPAWAM